MGKKAKRDTRKNKEYKSGAMKAFGDSLKDEYGKVNFKDRAIARWNKTTAPTRKKRRQAPNPFGNIRGLAGLGSGPKLGARPQRPRRRNA
jgi:hypothetical protein